LTSPRHAFILWFYFLYTLYWSWLSLFFFISWLVTPAIIPNLYSFAMMRFSFCIMRFLFLFVYNNPQVEIIIRVRIFFKSFSLQDILGLYRTTYPNKLSQHLSTLKCYVFFLSTIWHFITHNWEKLILDTKTYNLY